MRSRTGPAVGPVLGVLAVLLALAAAGCGRAASGDNAVATAGGATAGPSASPSGDPADLAVKFQACMKEQGVEVQVGIAGGGDSGGAPVQISPGTDAGPQIDRQKVEAAMEKCKQYAPNGGEPPKPDPAMAEKMLEFAKCMRDNGVANFPDPDANGGTVISEDSGIDPNSESFKTAQQKCQQLMPTPPGPRVVR